MALASGCAPNDFDEVVHHDRLSGQAPCADDAAATEGGCAAAELEGDAGPSDPGELVPDLDAGAQADLDAETPAFAGAEDASEQSGSGEPDANSGNGCRACAADAGQSPACGGRPVCVANELATDMEPCGSCGAGVHVRTRRCSADGCTWAAWSAWGACSSADTACEPGKIDTQMQPCGGCNTGGQTRTRACSAKTCTWDAWSEWSACAGVTAACSPGESMPCSPADSCGQRVCQADCTWSGCVPVMPDGCLRRRDGTQEEGSNYRCCGVGKWQFCLPDCHWSTDCAACSQDAPDYCSDCS